MKTPYDINEAKRWFDNAEKAARRAIALVAAGDESAVAKARFQRDKMGELLRWFYHDDPPYYEAAKAREQAVAAALIEALEAGQGARQRGRDEQIQNLRREEADRDAHLDPATRQYRREISKLKESPLDEAATAWSWGIWDETAKRWMHDPLTGSHRPEVPARYRSRDEAERAADANWRRLNPDRKFAARRLPSSTVREAPRASKRDYWVLKFGSTQNGVELIGAQPPGSHRSLSGDQIPDYVRTAAQNVQAKAAELMSYSGDDVQYMDLTIPNPGDMREAPRAGNPATKPGKYGTLYLYRITYKDANDGGSPEFTQDTWAYSLEHIDDITESWGEDGWEIISVARVPAGGGSMHRAIKHRTRETGRVVADFNTLPDLLDHAQRELGATHVLPSATDAGYRIYFPRGGQYPYEEATVWRKNGYWHAQGPGSRTGVERLPRDARPISGTAGRRAAEAPRRGKRLTAATAVPGTPVEVVEYESMYRGFSGTVVVPDTHMLMLLSKHERDQVRHGYVLVRQHEFTRPFAVPPHYLERAKTGTVVEDYAAVDSRDRTIAGPFKHYSDAQSAAGPGGHVKFVPSGGHRAGEAYGRRRFRRDQGDVPRWKQDEEEWNRNLAAYKSETDPLKQGRTRIDGGRELIERGLEVPTNGTVIASLSDPRKHNEPVAHFRHYPGLGYGESWGLGTTYYVDAGVLPEGTNVRESRGRNVSSSGDESRGESYADDQLRSPYFMDWSWQQMCEARDMKVRDPSSVIPLNSKADYRELARRMLQDMEFDTRRDLQETPGFFEGFRRKIRSKETVDWLAEELENMQAQLESTPAVAEEAAVERRHASGRRRRAIKAGDSVEAGVHGESSYETGVVDDVSRDGSVLVRWSNGDRTWIEAGALRVLSKKGRRAPKARKPAKRKPAKR